MSKILVTGTAGFIGFHLAQKLLSEGHKVTGLDIINDYYDINLKYARLAETGIKKGNIKYNNLIKSTNYPDYSFIKLGIEDKESLDNLFQSSGFDYVVNLAAQAGVRYSIENPMAYVNSNIIGFANILEACRHNNIKHLIYASSSSVYGLNEKMPFSTRDNVDHPISLYAASKKSNELMAHTYSHLFGLPTTGLRFFTVYGPWGRPDMALYIFTKAITEGKKIQIFNKGDMFRDFTYIDDIVNSLSRIIENIPRGDPDWSGKKPDPSSSPAAYRIFNIGNNSPVKLMDFVKAIENEIGAEANKEFLPMQPGDVKATWADVNSLIETINYTPSTSINTGIKNFISWYKKYYHIN
ncbi:MAG TPA: NAD-dependent epimerase [Bacteroidales bacterium]|mgnify:CR=1 FL=1|nr:NAD-dependent epimerase [Bacteroidales bacterium]